MSPFDRWRLAGLAWLTLAVVHQVVLALLVAWVDRTRRRQWRHPRWRRDIP